jgi:uncharacterized protein with LGFP repeats
VILGFRGKYTLESATCRQQNNLYSSRSQALPNLPNVGSRHIRMDAMVDHVVDANGNYGNISVGWNQATQTCEDADGGVAISTCIDNLRIDCSGMQRAFHLSGICFAEINALAFDIVVANDDDLDRSGVGPLAERA